MPKLQVLFEAGPILDRQKSGVGYYVGRLADSLRTSYPKELELTGFYFNFLNRTNEVPPDNVLNLHKVWLVPGKLLSLCRRLGFQPPLSLFVRGKFEIVLFTNYVSLPLRKRQRMALVVYDLGFLDAPEFVQARNLRHLQKYCPASIRRADTIITISEFTRSRLLYHFPGLHAEIVVTPVPPSSSPIADVQLDQKLLNLGIRAKGYILYVGTLEPRKNLETLMQAYADLASGLRERYSLVLAGGKGWKDETILQALNEHRSKGVQIITTGYVDEAQKSSLYQNAACFVLPSHYEGFGMPILEAMQYEVPVALSDIPVFREVAGHAGLYFDKDSPADVAGKISQLLQDPALVARLRSRSQKQLEVHSWGKNAEIVYEALLRQKV